MIFPYVYTLATDKLLSYDRKALCFLLHCFGWILFKRFFSYSWDIRLPLTPDADKKAIGKSASLTDALVDTLGWSTLGAGKSPALVHYNTDTSRCGLWKLKLIFSMSLLNISHPPIKIGCHCH
jgi:hypothetical protein